MIRQSGRGTAVTASGLAHLRPDAQSRRPDIPDLARSLNVERRDFKRPDAVERVVRELTGVGLVEIGSGRVQPTAAALRFIAIIESGV